MRFFKLLQKSYLWFLKLILLLVEKENRLREKMLNESDSSTVKKGNKWAEMISTFFYKFFFPKLYFR